jgi:hypothetical protein
MSLGLINGVLWEPLPAIVNMWKCLYFYLLGVQGLNGVGGGFFVCSFVMPFALGLLVWCLCGTSLFDLGQE